MKTGTHEVPQEDKAPQGSSDRAFGLVLGIFFVILGVWPIFRGGPLRLSALAAGGIILSLAAFLPVLLHPFNRLWIRLGRLLAMVTNPIIMGILFYVLFTPFAFFLRLAGKDPLRLKFDRNADTYWMNRRPAGPLPETMRNQY